MSGYLYFPNNLKDIEDHIPYTGLYDKLQNLFPINGNSFQRKPKPKLPLTFYSSIRFVFETVFISEQILENWFGTLSEISDKLVAS